MTEADSLKESTLQKLVAKLINGTQAAEILQLSVRQVRRLRKRFVKKGVKGILHQSRGTVSNKAVPKAVKKEIIKLIKSNYPDFGPTLAAEKLFELHKINFSNETIRIIQERVKEGQETSSALNTEETSIQNIEAEEAIAKKQLWLYWLDYLKSTGQFSRLWK